MSDKVNMDEMEKLLRQLQGQDLEAIGRRLGLNLQGADKSRALQEAMEKNAELRARVRDLALTLPARAKCSFCGEAASDERKVIASPSGARICSSCLQGFKGPAD